MVIKMSELMRIGPVIDMYMNKQMKISGAYKFNKIKEVCDKELSFFQSEFNKIIDEYVKRDEDGNPVRDEEDQNKVLIQEDKIDECNDKLKDLHNIEVHFDDCYLLNTADLLNETSTPQELQALMPFISE